MTSDSQHVMNREIEIRKLAPPPPRLHLTCK
jgi:hypothetical protein